MIKRDVAEYIGPDPAYKGQQALIKPDEKTYELPLEQRMCRVQWMNPDLPCNDADGPLLVGTNWHKHFAKNFAILARSPVEAKLNV